MNKVLKRILGDPQIKTLKRLKKRVKEINDLADKYEKMPDSKLKAQTGELKKRLKKNRWIKSCLMLLQWFVSQHLEH